MSVKENLKNYDWKKGIKKNGFVSLVYGVGMLCFCVSLDLIHGLNQKPKAQQALPEGKNK